MSSSRSPSLLQSIVTHTTTMLKDATYNAPVVKQAFNGIKGASTTGPTLAHQSSDVPTTPAAGFFAYNLEYDIMWINRFIHERREQAILCLVVALLVGVVFILIACLCFACCSWKKAAKRGKFEVTNKKKREGGCFKRKKNDEGDVLLRNSTNTQTLGIFSNKSDDDNAAKKGEIVTISSKPLVPTSTANDEESRPYDSPDLNLHYSNPNRPRLSPTNRTSHQHKNSPSIYRHTNPGSNFQKNSPKLATRSVNYPQNYVNDITAGDQDNTNPSLTFPTPASWTTVTLTTNPASPSVLISPRSSKLAHSRDSPIHHSHHFHHHRHSNQTKSSSNVNHDNYNQNYLIPSQNTNANTFHHSLPRYPQTSPYYAHLQASSNRRQTAAPLVRNNSQKENVKKYNNFDTESDDVDCVVDTDVNNEVSNDLTNDNANQSVHNWPSPPINYHYDNTFRNNNAVEYDTNEGIGENDISNYVNTSLIENGVNLGNTKLKRNASAGADSSSSYALKGSDSIKRSSIKNLPARNSPFGPSLVEWFALGQTPNLTNERASLPQQQEKHIQEQRYTIPTISHQQISLQKRANDLEEQQIQRNQDNDAILRKKQKSFLKVQRKSSSNKNSQPTSPTDHIFDSLYLDKNNNNLSFHSYNDDTSKKKNKKKNTNNSLPPVFSAPASSKWPVPPK